MLGGRRRGFPEEVELRIIQHIKTLLTATPTLTASLLVAHIARDLGVVVSATYIKSVLAAADWTYGILFLCYPDRIVADPFIHLIVPLGGKYLKQNRSISTRPPI